MLRLDTTTRKLQAVLAGAVTTNQLHCVVSYSDHTSTAYNGGTQLTSTNSTTAVDICDAPAASTVRDIDYVNIRNRDTAAATVTVMLDNSGADSEIVKTTLAVGDQLVYTHGDGWKTLDASGQVKSSASGGGGGKLAQSLTATTANYVGLSSTIPLDDTIPQNTEGTEILTQAITPTNASSTIRVTARVTITSPAGSGGTFIAALFKDTTADALRASSVYCAAGGIAGLVDLTYEESAGSTSARTYKLRGGPSSAITMYYNGDASGRKFGGVSAIPLTVQEILP